MNRAGLLAGAAVAAVVAGGVVLYAERGRIAEDAARQWLTDHGVAASQVDIQGLSMTGFSARVRIGDPKDPDLTVERMEVRYALSGPWSGDGLGANVSVLRLVRPRLKARWVNGALTFGAVDGVIKAIEQLPATKAPLPDVTVEDGEAGLLAPGGSLHMHVSGSLRAGALTTLQGQIDPFKMAFGAGRIDSAGGAVSVVSFRGRLTSRVDLGAVGYASPGQSVRARHMLLSAEAPYPAGRGAWSGPATVSLQVGDLAGNMTGTAFDGGAANLTVEGVMDLAGERQIFRGDAMGSGQAATIVGSGLTARLAAGHATFSGLSLANDGTGMTAHAAARASLAVGEVVAKGARLTGLTSQMRSEALNWRAKAGAMALSGAVSGNLVGRGVARAPAGDAPYAAAIRQALHDFKFADADWRADFAGSAGGVRLAAPLTLVAASGARATVSAEARASAFAPLAGGGSAALTLDGGGLPRLKAEVWNATFARGVLAGAVSVQGTVDAPPAKGVQFAIAGRGMLDGGGGRVVLASCAPVTIERLALDPNPATSVAARLCGAAGPLFEADRRGWRAAARFEDLKGDMPSAQTGLRGGTGSFVTAGTAAGLTTATVVLDQAEIKDSADPLRFQPLVGAGRMEVGRGQASGTFEVGLPKQPPLATIAVRHDLASGVGRADIDAPTVVFASGGLQPTDISPLAAAARDAQGPLTFTGWFSWSPGANLKSGGEAIAKNFKFNSPVGPVVGLDADIRFTSLLPLVTAPDQTLSVSQVQSVLPVNALAAQFGLGAEHLTLTTAGGAMAKGHVRLEPMKVALAQDATFQGAIVFDHVDLGEVLAATNLSDMVKATAVVNGRIPFEVGPKGITIQQGHLAAVGPGRLSISRKALNGVTAGAGTPDQPNFAQDLAYQAMENLAFDQMDATINSQANDRLGMLFHIKGRHDPPTRQKATLAVRDVLSGHAMDKPLTLPSDTKIDLTLDTSLNFGDLVKALAQAWRDALAPSGASTHSRPVQGPPPKNPGK